jgi:hypothetical protein
MEILIHGTKDGYKILFKTTEFPKVFSIGELRLEGVENNRATVGSDFFSISFSHNGCIISKGICVWDEVRRAIGNIIFSIYIPNGKQLIGSEVKTLLDELCGKYVFEFITDGNISNKQEDWSLFESIANQYALQTNSSDDIENYQLGKGEAAYIYYQDEIELLKYLDKPYQREYSAFKQVFLVDNKFNKKEENPLNVIRHDMSGNLTGKKVLENMPFKLNYESKNGVKIEVYVNGNLAKINSNIKPNDDVEIIWSKPYCKTENSPKEKLKDSINNFDLDRIGNKVSVKNKDLNPIIYPFELNYPNINIHKNDEIDLYFNGNIRKVENNTLNITEEELQNKCHVKAKKGNLTSAVKEIRINSDKTIELVLKEPKLVKFVIHDEFEYPKYNCTIQIKNKHIQPVNGEVLFEGDEISKEWNVRISNSGYDHIDYPCLPENVKDDIHLTLHKKQNSQQKPIEQTIIKTETPWYKETRNILWFLMGLVIIASSYSIYFFEFKEESTVYPIENSNYTNGIELKKEKLDEIKKDCNKSNKETEKSLFEKLWPFEANENGNQENNNQNCNGIENAIAIREAINLGNIDILKGMKYSDEQSVFKEAIIRIQKENIKLISDTLRLNKVSDLNLNEVADRIDKALKELMRDSTNKEAIKKETITQIPDEPTEKSTPINQPKVKKESKPVETKQENVNKNNFEKEFYKLIKKEDVKQIEFENLYKNYKIKPNVDTEMLTCLKELATNKKTFGKFKNIAIVDIIAINNLEKLNKCLKK